MKELIETIVAQLVDDPNNVTVLVDEAAQTIDIRVDKSEIGRVIGKQGRIAKSIRSIVKAASMRQNKRYSVEIDER